MCVMYLCIYLDMNIFICKHSYTNVITCMYRGEVTSLHTFLIPLVLCYELHI